MSDTALLVPDPRVSPVPAGWWDSHVRPMVTACESWRQLNEYEGQLQAMANIVESLGGDSLEFQKALRVVEARRGELLGPNASHGGDRKSPNFQVPRMELEGVPSPARWRSGARSSCHVRYRTRGASCST